MKYEHDITLEEYNAKLGQQNNCYAICGKHEKEFKNKFHIDHNSKTG